MRFFQQISDTAGHKITLDQLGDVKVINWIALVLLLIGFIFRISPIFDIEHHLFWQYMTEDGYLMQTIARNMAIGLGMSTAEGTLPTNGVQPLATLLFAGLHYLAGGDKAVGIVYVTIFSAITILLASWFLRGLIITLFKEWEVPPNLALLVAALWFASPLIVNHSMNGLETGLYYLSIIATIQYYSKLDLSDSTSMKTGQRLILGVLLGITFLSRNDAVFFIAALLSAHVLSSDTKMFKHIAHRLTDAIIAGTISVIVGSPWLIYNKLNFGSIMPISGTAESHSSVFGENFMMMPANLLEASLTYLPIPRALEDTLTVFIISLIIIGLFGLIFWSLFAKSSLKAKRFFITTYIFVICISSYYGLLFGASWFVTRYTSALSPMLLIISFSGIYVLLSSSFNKQTLKAATISASVLLLTVSLISLLITFKNGSNHMHKPIVDWAVENLDKSEWAGATQTGTLGYFHDRTINLDGKTNYDALQALLKEGHNLNYIMDSNIEYIIDWIGMCEWVKSTQAPRFGNTFNVLVKDKPNNLCVMQRTK